MKELWNMRLKDDDSSGEEISESSDKENIEENHREDDGENAALEPSNHILSGDRNNSLATDKSHNDLNEGDSINWSKINYFLLLFTNSTFLLFNRSY